MARADAELSQAEQHQQQARSDAKPDDAKSKKAVSDADAKVAAAEKKLAEARAALAKPPKPYTPLGPVFPASSTGRRAARRLNAGGGRGMVRAGRPKGGARIAAAPP